MPGFAPAPTPVIIMVPLNFEPAVLGLSGVLHATHWVAVSVFGLPQLGQKIVTGALRITASVDRSPAAQPRSARGRTLLVHARQGKSE